MPLSMRAAAQARDADGWRSDMIQKVKTAVIGCGMISNIYIRNLKHLF